MAGQILAPEHYLQARLLLGVDEARIPDETVELAIFLAAAEDDLFRVLPTTLATTGEDRDRVIRATIYFLAARLIPLIAGDLNITGEQWGDEYRYTSKGRSASDLTATWRETAMDLLGPLLPDPRPGRAGLFSLVAGRRA